MPIQFRRVSSFLLKLMILFALATPYALARAGGGGAGGGGGLLTLILLPFAIAYALYMNHRINKKKKATELLLNTLSQNDPAWNEANLEARVRQTFLQIEVAWVKQDLAQLESLLHPQLFSEWKAQIELMQSNGERNIMEDLRIVNVRLVEAQNYRDKEKDIFTACIDAVATDYTIGANGEIVSSNTGSRRKKANKEKTEEGFREFWTYERHDEKWLLLRVDQEKDWKKSVDAELVDEK
ncbi:MAG: Tim44-like domain-containing protein [Terracidiphilus sp.]